MLHKHKTVNLGLLVKTFVYSNTGLVLVHTLKFLSLREQIPKADAEALKAKLSELGGDVALE